GGALYFTVFAGRPIFLGGTPLRKMEMPLWRDQFHFAGNPALVKWKYSCSATGPRPSVARVRADSDGKIQRPTHPTPLSTPYPPLVNSYE
ncbi:MAG: hypothetical protein MN733_14950, partial [Nitrososphaera sp.]|nr:hypothetical protein [Nitrososphaera sp.]